MANLRETAEWIDGIYQIEKTDPVVGGEGGISNRQAEQLAARTQYLKKEVEKSAVKNSPNFTGVPTAPTAPQSTNNGQIATTEFVKTAIAALVGSAPAELDTLEELAAMLAENGDLRRTLLQKIGEITTALQGFLPKSGGRVTGPVVADFSDYSNFQTVNSSGEVVKWESTPSHDPFMATISQFLDGTKLHTVKIPKKTGIVLLSGDFSQHIAENGWCKLPNGLILQWGRLSPRYETVADYAFNVAFPNQCFFVLPTHSIDSGKFAQLGTLRRNAGEAYAVGPKDLSMELNAYPVSRTHMRLWTDNDSGVEHKATSWIALGI